MVIRLRLGRELSQLQAAQARLQVEQQESQQRIAALQAQLQSKQGPVSNPGEFTLPEPSTQPSVVMTLSGGLARGPGKANVVPLSSGIATLVLVLASDRDATYASYNIALETPGGKTILKQNGVKSWLSAKDRLTMVALPARVLPRGDYVLRLIGVDSNHKAEDVDAYSFTVRVH
jgi:hypothetical protein